MSGEALRAIVLWFRSQPRTAGIGYWVVECARGRRLACRAVALLARWALTETSLARVEALVEPDNTPSQRFLEGSGFHREHTYAPTSIFDTRRADALIYSLLPSDLDQ